MPESIEVISHLVNGHIFGAEDSCFRNCQLSDAMPLQDARSGDLTLVDSLQHLDAWLASPAVVALAPIAIAEELASKSRDKLIVGVNELHLAFHQVIVQLRGERCDEFSWTGIHATAVVHPSATVAASASIGPYVTIGAGCNIGERTRIHPGVQVLGYCQIAEDCEIFPSAVLYHGTVLHPRVLVHASSILGAYGFGYRQINHQHVRTSQLGWVEVECDVEIGAGTTIDRGTYGPTRIGRGTKLDNQIQIGHNVHLGEHNLLCAQVGIAGSSSTGDYVVLGGQVGVRDHIHLGDRVSAAAQSGIANDLSDGISVLGSPALPRREATQMWVHSQRLPEIRKQIKSLETQLSSLIEKMEASLAHSEGQAIDARVDISNTAEVLQKTIFHNVKPENRAAA